MDGKIYKRKTILNTLLILLILGLFGASSYWFKKDMNKYAGDISLSRGTIAATAKSLEILAALKQGSGEMSGYQKEIERLLPISDDLISFSVWLENEARSIQTVKVAASLEDQENLSQNGFPAYRYFSISADGPYSDLTGYLERIEVKKKDYLMTVDTVSITKNGDAYHLAARGKVYFRKITEENKENVPS
ncbi:MAG: hypothetical protein V1856_01150 [Candidatus Liptonbacteria bacterium]